MERELPTRSLPEFFPYFLLALCCLMSACGGSDKIAVEMRPRIVFSKQLVRVTFPLEAAYTTEIEKSVGFDALGSLFVKFDKEKKQSSLGVQLLATREELQKPWPADDFQNLPRAKRVSSFFRKAKLKAWVKNENDIQTALLYSTGERLFIGGFISSEQLRVLGKGFYAYQRFLAANYETIGMIAAVGPEKETGGFPGGIFFLSDFGSNPFVSSTQQPVDQTATNLKMPEAFRPLAITDWRTSSDYRELKFPAEPSISLLQEESAP